MPQEQSPVKTKAYINKALQRFSAQKEFARIQVVIDVDALWIIVASSLPPGPQ